LVKKEVFWSRCVEACYSANHLRRRALIFFVAASTLKKNIKIGFQDLSDSIVMEITSVIEMN